MSEAGSAVLPKPEQKPAAPEQSQRRITELRVSGHLMTLDTGVFCVFQAVGSPVSADGSGLPGVRISLPPGSAGNPDAVSISTFRSDGWLSGRDAAALIRVSDGPAQVLVTVYQAPGHGVETAPRLQVLRLSQDNAAADRARAQLAAAGAEPPEVVVHVQRMGDLGGKMGDWLGEPGSKLWIEGFAVTPPPEIAAEDIEYQAVLGRGWNSPWVEGGNFCGSRGMALPLLGLKLRLKGEAAKSHTVSYAASFVDGTTIGPVEEGEPCEAESLAAMEALQVLLSPRAEASVPRDKPASAKPPAAARKPAPRPAPAAAVRRAR
jgi:hypothetical protein